MKPIRLSLIKSDLYRYTGKYSHFLLIKHLLWNNSFKYTFWLRLASNHGAFPVRWLARFMHRRLSAKLLIQIPIGTKIGYGLYIGHGMSLVVNETTVIGNNVNLSQFTTIGSNDGKSATIGDNVYIGPNVCIVEDVVIGNNVSIGAGSVVVKDIPVNATAAGVPAKVISYKTPSRYINNKYEIF